MIHIVFQEADIDALKKSFELDETLRGDVLQVKDDYAVGPLRDLYTEEGRQVRKQWWAEVLTGGHYEQLIQDDNIDDNKLVSEITSRLDNDSSEKLWIWAAQNKHDVSGYYWLISQLQAYQGRVFILYLNNLPFINDKGQIFYPVNLFQISPREFVKAKKLARPVTLSEFEIDPDEWKKLADEAKGVRILEGGKKLVQYDYDYYDKELLAFISSDWQKVNRLFHSYYNKARQTTGDAFLLWRLKLLVESGAVEMQGDMKSMKDFEVKVPATDQVQVQA
jgi:hypothetical protein